DSGRVAPMRDLEGGSFDLRTAEKVGAAADGDGILARDGNRVRFVDSRESKAHFSDLLLPIGAISGLRREHAVEEQDAQRLPLRFPERRANPLDVFDSRSGFKVAADERAGSAGRSRKKEACTGEAYAHGFLGKGNARPPPLLGETPDERTRMDL